MIYRVSVERNDTVLYVSTILDEKVKEDIVFAFYLYKDGNRVNTVWYQKENNTAFPISDAGIYKVKGFIKISLNQIYSKDSKEILVLEEKIYNIGSLDINTLFSSSSLNIKVHNCSFPCLFFPKQDVDYDHHCYYT